jgi:hypothetical protein
MTDQNKYFNIHTIKQPVALTRTVIVRYDKANYKIEIDDASHTIVIKKDSNTDCVIEDFSLKWEIFKRFKEDHIHKYLLKEFNYGDII